MSALAFTQDLTGLISNNLNHNHRKGDFKKAQCVLGKTLLNT